MDSQVYICSMNLRGDWAALPEGFIRLNVTSAQGKENNNRRDFSPMTHVEGGYKGFWNFESYWQSGKVFEGIPQTKTLDWWKKNKEAKRRYPGSKGYKVLYAQWNGGEKMDYITSRKKVYVPEYYNLIKDREQVKYYKDLIKKGNKIAVYDFDGPRTIDGKPSCVPVTLKTLKEKINDTRFPFGHGYVVASLLLSIKPEEYTETPKTWEMFITSLKFPEKYESVLLEQKPDLENPKLTQLGKNVIERILMFYTFYIEHTDIEDVSLRVAQRTKEYTGQLVYIGAVYLILNTKFRTGVGYSVLYEALK